ncbi:MAG: tripartite tricarboxylate transporter permease [Desulfobacterales bacterium]|nr:tripartite tricarboxylate transporter permease [Desulfobacterales bacterium]
MIDALIEGFFLVLEWPAVGYMCVGILFGLFMGFTPGIGGPVTLALVLPFVFGLNEVSAVAFLLGTHSVVVTGGSVTAILFGVPGAGPNAATIIDGYPMAQKGEAGRAIGAALTASALGGLLGTLILALLIPILRPLVLVFGPPEFFMLAILGVVFLATLSGDEPLKGVVAGLFGLMLSLIGEEQLMGTKRYSFGLLYLWDGIKLVPAVIGLFAIAEMVDLLLRGGSIAKTDQQSSTMGPWTGVQDVFKRWGLFLRSSIVGVVIGIIPGLGGDVACFLAYGQAAQTAKKGEVPYGKGNVGGVIAPEAANNAKEGGALVPTIAFGIPGSGSMAILLGALLIVGITPGAPLLNEKLNITFAMVWTLAIANVLGAAVMFLLANKLSKITFLEGSLIAPIVLSICFIGAYMTTNSIGDIIVALVLGFIGFEMKRLNYSRAALLLGLVLGRIVEQNLFLSLRLFGGSFAVRPITLVLIVISVLVLGWSFLKPWLWRKEQNNASGSQA